jgi:hypothetical protein
MATTAEPRDNTSRWTPLPKVGATKWQPCQESPTQSTRDAAALTPQILAQLDGWRDLMGRRVGEARQILRRLLVGRITFTPQADGAWSSSATGRSSRWSSGRCWLT